MTKLKNEKSQLLRIVAQVRRRWRARQVLQGFGYLALTLVAVLWLSGVGLEQARFAPGAILGLRILSFLALVFVVVRWIVMPLLRGVTDERVALYMEEHEPALGEALLTAVSSPTSSESTGSLQAGLVREAVRKARRANNGRNIERDRLKRSAGLLAVAAAAAVATLLFGPNYLRHGASALFFPTVSATDANPYSITVAPGDATISRGSDQVIEATLIGFSGADVTLFRRSEGGETFEPMPMVPADSMAFEALLYELGSATEYFVESTGVRSPTYRIDVADLPYVGQLELVYHFPEYTGLEPQTIEDGGDIAVLRGTRIEVRATPTLPTPAGTVVFADSSRAELAVDTDGVLAGSFEVTQPSSYGIELRTDQNVAVAGSPDYAIDVLEDQPPSVSIKKPGRDSSASAIEEVYIEVEGRDDYGVGRMELVYSVNGGEEATERIFGASRAITEASAGHTFFLEDLELQPGDFVAYYARARDNDAVNGRKSVESDMYFLQIRSFEKDFVQAEQAGGGGGGGGGAEMESGLPEQQRQIISGTFNVKRDRSRYSAEEFAENVVTVALAQDRLVEQVERLVEQMKQRGISESDPAFKTILEELPKAVVEMEVAVDSLEANKPDAALPAEQRALQHLLRAEEAYRTVQVSQGQQQGGGGGGGAQAEDLADLFQLELDKMKNQYETVQRQSEQQMEQAVDETLERLKELARRQEQAAERQRRLAQQGGGGGGAAGEAQRDLAEQTEEAARQLERLARENESQQLAETARELQDAAQAMRQSAGARGNTAAGQAREALDKLRDARRLLEKNQADRPARAAEDAVQRVQQLAEEQREIRREVQTMPVVGDRGERMRRLVERKTEMEQEVADLERELDRASREAGRDPEQREAARGLEEAANWIRDSKLKEKIRYTRAVIENRPDQTTRPLEQDIEGDLERLRELTEDAAGSVNETGAGEASEAMDRTRDLVRGLESMDERLSERAESERAGRRLGQQPGGEEGEQGSGEPGEQNGEGQEGAEGQSGQEGQGQQGQQGQGQQGQGGQEGQGGGQQGQGQGGGQPGGQAGGQQGGMGQGGMANGAGVRNGGEPLTEDEVRQLRREFRERAADAQALRGMLNEMGEDTGDLDELLRGLRQMDSERVYMDVQEIQRLQAALLEVAKRFEFSFRRRVEGEDDELLLRGSDEVPAGFEEMIEEYYRALARGRGGR